MQSQDQPPEEIRKLIHDQATAVRQLTHDQTTVRKTPRRRRHLTPNVRKRVEVLKEIQSHHNKLARSLLEERATLEAKYHKLYETLYSKRYDIVNGVVEVEGASSEAAVDQEKDSVAEGTEKQVPEFWLTVMKASDDLAEMITLHDEGALKYLKDIKWCYIHHHVCFKLEFFFDPNPYFKNTVLTKTFHITADKEEPVLERVEGSEIEWLPGKSLTQKLMKIEPEEGAKIAEPIFEYQYCNSFFNFFIRPEVPEDESDIDTDVVEELQNQMKEDYDIGCLIRDKIIPYAVLWFTGKADEEDESGRSLNERVTDRKGFLDSEFSTPFDIKEPPECKQQ